MTTSAPSRNLDVATVLRRWPASAAVFHRHGMACVGCAMAPFETVAEACRAYDVNAVTFLQELATLAGSRPRRDRRRKRGD